MPESSKRRGDHIALYGNVKIQKAWCQECGGWAFVLDGKLACCGEKYKPDPTHFRRISNPVDERRLLGKADRDAILQAQDHACFYCEQKFGAKVYVDGKLMVLKIAWDHMLPFSFGQNNYAENIVAACQVCNNWKSAMIFNSIEEAKVFLNGKWEKHKTTRPDFVPELYGIVRA